MLIVAGASAATPSITEYPIAGSANPDQISAGLPTDPATSVWVTDPYGGAATAGLVYRVDVASGKLSGTFAPAAGATVPTFIKPGPDGRMWTSDFNGTLMRAASDGVFEKVGPDGYAHGGLAVGPDGNVWYVSETGGANTGQVGFIDPTTLAVSDFDIPTANSHPNEITAGPPSDPNSMWFTEEFADRIGRVDTNTHVVTDYGGLTAGSRPNGIVVGSDGGLWFAEYGTGKIGRIDPATHAVSEYGAAGQLDGPDRMTVAPDGRIWFTLFNGSQVGSFIPGPNPTFELIATPTAGAQPSGITIGPDGHVWFAEYANHAVARIDEGSSGLPHTTIDTGPSGTITDTTATFTFHADDPAASFQCSLDAGAFAPCSSPHAIGPLSIGDHTFTVHAVNAAGTEPVPPSRSFTVAAAPTPPPSINKIRPAIVQSTRCVYSGGGLGGGCTEVPIDHSYRCDPGRWRDINSTMPFSYEWQRETPDSSYFGGYRYDTVATGETYYAQASNYIDYNRSWQFRCVVTATGPGGQTRAFSQTVTLDPAPPTNPLEQSVNIRVTGIEVTQGVQTECCAPSTLPRRTDGPDPTTRGVVSYQGKGITLAAGKLTVVRVFAGYNRPTLGPDPENATATLTVFDSDGQWIATWPADTSPKKLPYDGCLCVTRAQRANPGASFNFEIPWQETLHQKLIFEATVDPAVGFGMPKQCFGCHANTFKLLDVPFLSTATVQIHPIPLTVGGARTSKSELQVFGDAQKVLPNDLQIFPYEAALPVDGLTTEQAAAAAAKFGRDNHYSGAQYPIGVFFNGEGKLANGYTVGGPLYTYTPGSAVQDDRPLTSVAHEIGHGLGLNHADTGSLVPGGGYTGSHPDGTPDCGGNSGIQAGNGGPWPPDDEGRLQSVGLDARNWKALQTGSLPKTFVEDYDLSGQSAPGTRYYDFMSYCPAGGVSESSDWISARNWNRLLAFELPGQSLPVAADRPRAAALGPQLQVIATVDSSGAVSIFDVAPTQAIPGGPPITPSPYRIELRDATGAVLASATPLTTSIHIDRTPGRRPPLLLQATMPMPAGTSALVVSSGGRELARRARSPHPPTVQILTPRPGASIGDAASTLVRWREGDADGNRLTATVDYSPGSGRQWKVVAARVSGDWARVPSRLLAASRDGRLRVRVSDGFNVTTATVAHLRAAGAPPVVRILGAGDGGMIRADRTLLLQGWAFDDSASPLSGTRLRWYGAGRLLGTGERITVQGLPAGATAIRLLATDAHGRTGSASLRLRVRAAAPAYLIIRAPLRISRRARRVRLVIAANTPATFTIAGRHYRVSRSPRTLTVPIHPGRSTLRLPCLLSSPGGAIHQTYVVSR